uniref:SAM domain-containing protein n=1 Tax=Haemonchus contortus TaxID=6289 RepID=A0A7I4XZR4_HAECO
MEPSPNYEEPMAAFEVCPAIMGLPPAASHSTTPPLDAHMLLEGAMTPTEEMAVSPLERSPSRENVFVGQRYTNKNGKPNILIFHLPDGSCYSFGFLQSKTQFDYYTCNECKKIKGACFRYKVIGDEFITNPHSNHLCTPLDAETEIAKRLRNQTRPRLSGTKASERKRTPANPRPPNEPAHGNGEETSIAENHTARGRAAARKRSKKTVEKNRRAVKPGTIFKSNSQSNVVKKARKTSLPISKRRKVCDATVVTENSTEQSVEHVSSNTSNSALPSLSSSYVRKDSRSNSVEILNVVVPEEVNKSTIHPNLTSSEVHRFLESLELDQYKARFTGFTLQGLSILTPDELMSMGLERSHAYCIYSTLKSRTENTFKDPTNKQMEQRGGLSIYVAESNNFSGELLYKLVYLKQTTRDELYSALKNCDIIRKSGRTRMFFVGPAGIKVQMSDDVISMWKSESVFAISSVNGVYHIQSMTR